MFESQRPKLGIHTTIYHFIFNDDYGIQLKQCVNNKYLFDTYQTISGIKLTHTILWKQWRDNKKNYSNRKTTPHTVNERKKKKEKRKPKKMIVEIYNISYPNRKKWEKSWTDEWL